MDLTNRLNAQIASFLRAYHDRDRPIALALSGGPDSLALFHLLLLHKNILDLHVLHVDHSWRPESSQEAEVLRQQVESFGFTFHLSVLKEGLPSRNAEDAAREARHCCFRELTQAIGCQAIMVGHQADDLAETMLKRLFEGASLTNGSPMCPVTQMDGFTLWRPLLQAAKKDLVAWLEQRNITAFVDSTNSDSKYLRTRLRHTILPQIAESFGKEIARPLASIAAECEELHVLLNSKLSLWLRKIERGLELDLTQSSDLHDIEIKYLIRRLCEKAGFVLSKDALTTACNLIKSNEANRQVGTKTGTLYIDCKRINIIFNAKRE